MGAPGFRRERHRPDGREGIGARDEPGPGRPVPDPGHHRDVQPLSLSLAVRVAERVQVAVSLPERVPLVGTPSPSASPSTSRAPSPTPPAAAPTLRYGDSGAEVEKLQRLLAARGLFTYKINGKFDWRVENAVSTFQYDNGIDEEWGVYGPLTRKALEG